MQFLPLKSHAPWWVKIQTKRPQCVYYFGPFASDREAQSYQSGYVEDLTQEGAQGIKVATRKGNPQQLTIFKGTR